MLWQPAKELYYFASEFHKEAAQTRLKGLHEKAALLIMCVFPRLALCFRPDSGSIYFLFCRRVRPSQIVFSCLLGARNLRMHTRHGRDLLFMGLQCWGAYLDACDR